MAINTIKRSLLEEIMDTVSIKAGLLLPQSKAISLLNKEAGNEGWWNGDLEVYIRIQFDEVEETFLSLMAAVGALPDDTHPNICLINYVRKNAQVLNIAPYDNMAVYKEVMRVSSVFEEYIRGVPIPENISILPSFEVFKNDYLNRHIYHENPPIEADWKTSIPLSSLFESEVIQGDERVESYFDQRYIDYLSKQTGDLSDIHWRQFEFLTGEYFKRSGYSVTVNKGRGDGGVDVVATKNDEIIGPEVIYVQCKKYSKNNPIQLDAVRAFWATVNDENATKGLIATTSRLTRGAEEYCKARLYRLSAFEEDKIIFWIKSMRKR